jgi:hypothetical protein
MAEAAQMQPDSPASQPQEPAHEQAAGQACGIARLADWQPQPQLVPGQFTQGQAEAKRVFMGIPFQDGRTRRVRGNESWGAIDSPN